MNTENVGDRHSSAAHEDFFRAVGPKEIRLLEILAFSAQIPWERVKRELSRRCGNLMLPFGVAVNQLSEEIRAGTWLV